MCSAKRTLEVQSIAHNMLRRQVDHINESLALHFPIMDNKEEIVDGESKLSFASSRSFPTMVHDRE